jgi:hypothetical protein
MLRCDICQVLFIGSEIYFRPNAKKKENISNMMRRYFITPPVYPFRYDYGLKRPRNHGLGHLRDISRSFIFL